MTSKETAAILASTSIADLGHALFAYSGYHRQAAVERAAQLADPELLPMVADRLNDWVPQVRDAARSAMLVMLPRMSSNAIWQILPTVTELRNKGRSDHSGWLDQFAQELIQYLQVDDLLKAIPGSDRKLARACFDLLRHHALVDHTVLGKVALSSRADIVLAVRGAQIIHLLPHDQQAALYATALQSHFGPVRTLGVSGLLRQPSVHDKRDLAKSFLLDPQSSVRGAAISFLVSDQFDVKSYYRTLLESPAATASQVRICLIALAGLRDATDVPLVRRFATHPLASVRLTALNAWFKLAEADKDTIARAALADSASSLKKVALAMVRRQHAYIPFDALLPDLLAKREWNLLLAFAQFEQWNWLEAICKIAFETGEHDDVWHDLQRDLQRWMHSNRSFTRPTSAQAEFLTSDRARAAFDTVTGNNKQFQEVLQRELALVLPRSTR
jgi:hypothetical protein